MISLCLAQLRPRLMQRDQGLELAQSIGPSNLQLRVSTACGLKQVQVVELVVRLTVIIINREY